MSEEHSLPLDAIYNVLVAFGGAAEGDRETFKMHWPACREWRFQGKFGFGGKVWYNGGRVYANYYPEDHTEQLDKFMEILNEGLTEAVRDTASPARYGEVIYTRPSPEEMDQAGSRIEIIRRNLSVLRDEVRNMGRGWASRPGDDQTYRDVEGLLTAALVMLYDPANKFAEWAATKREKLAQPERYVITEGFADQRQEDGLVEVLWWDNYHTRFGPNLSPMPWREP